MEKETGGPAFPSSCPVANRGMTLRDWFAGQALYSLFKFDRNRRLITDPEEAARSAYLFADAMLKEREK